MGPPAIAPRVLAMAIHHAMVHCHYDNPVTQHGLASYLNKVGKPRHSYLQQTDYLKLHSMPAKNHTSVVGV